LIWQKRRRERIIVLKNRWDERKKGTVWQVLTGVNMACKSVGRRGSFAYVIWLQGRKGTPSEGMIYLFLKRWAAVKWPVFKLSLDN